MSDQDTNNLNTNSSIVAYQGIEGSYSHVACTNLFNSEPSLREKQVQYRGLDDFKAVFDSLTSGTVEYGFIPIENSSTGTFLWNYDLLSQYNVFIVGEYCYKESHCLVALPGVSIDQITEIRSHPYVIDQCKMYLKELKASNKRKNTTTSDCEITISQSLDTAGSAQSIKNGNLKNVAAIAGSSAAQIYGLDILESEIEDRQNTITRYFLLSCTSIKPQRFMDPYNGNVKEPTRCIIQGFFPIYVYNNALYKVVSCFAMRDVNICKIESRPSSRSITLARPWEYVIYLDVDGGINEDVIQNAIKHLQEFSQRVKVLGSYPKFHAHEVVSHIRGM